MNYLPDSIYTLCGSDVKACTNCSNVVWSPVTNSLVHDSQTGKVFCPFGTNNSMNQSIFTSIPVDQNTKWGHAPQFEPRSLSKIGLEWRTS